MACERPAVARHHLGHARLARFWSIDPEDLLREVERFLSRPTTIGPLSAVSTVPNPTEVLGPTVTLPQMTAVGAIRAVESMTRRLPKCSCVIMENAVVRGTKRHPATISDHVLVGPSAYLSGCTVYDCAFLATGSRVFSGATVETAAGRMLTAGLANDLDGTVYAWGIWCARQESNLQANRRKGANP
jgi:hypothetical protein